jgi:sterol desaturase/sphingolipid hydroxylase (fatty acid hydroxylase superfamily)
MPRRAQVKFHDIHHWYPDSNYGQYIMMWDHVFGWFKPYPTTSKGVRSDGEAARVSQKEE